MHVKTRHITFSAILLAFAVIFVYGGTVIATNTLFFLAAASFCLGIVIAECGRRAGVIFFIACSLLTFILVPNKMHCITLAAMNFYILIKAFTEQKMNRVFFYAKYVFFNIFYIPALCFVPSLFYTGKINSYVLIGLWIGGQIGFWVYDYVYGWFIGHFWKGIRKRLFQE